MNRHLVVMLKEPQAGRVKTRLGKEIGTTSAAWWFRHQTTALLRRLESPLWHIWLAVSPDHAGLRSRIWPAHLPRIPQGRGDLGDRMARVFRALPAGPACIIGGDIPGIRQHHIRRAFQNLGQNDATFGPAPDGGYWLIGLKRQSAQSPQFLQNVRWSSEYALADSIASMRCRTVGLVDTLQDIDTLADLTAFRHIVKSRKYVETPATC